MTLEQMAKQAMIDAAKNAGIDNPDEEQLHWDSDSLMYGSYSLYPDSYYQKIARQSWIEYQNS